MKKLILPLTLIFFCSVLITLSCNDPHKFWKEKSYRFFITAATYNGNLGGIAGADAKCMADANYPGYGTYKAFLVDDAGTRVASVTANLGNGQVDWVLKPNTTYYRSDAVTEVFTTDANSLFVLSTGIAATNSINNTTTQYWTGIFNLGDWTTWVGRTCLNWTDGTAGQNGTVGQGDQTGTGLIFFSSFFCSNVYSLLCVKQ